MHFKHNPGLDKEVFYDYSTQSPNLNKIGKNKAWQGCFKYSVCACVFSYFSHVWLCATLWTVACQAPLSMGFSRQEYWSGLPCPPAGDLPNPEIKPMASPASSAMQANSLPLSHPGSPSHFSQAWLFVTLWTWSTRASLSTGFSRQEHWNRVPYPPPRDLPHPGVEPRPYICCIGRQILCH